MNLAGNYFWATPNGPEKMMEMVIADPAIRGMSLHTSWEKVETEQDTYDWTALDKAYAMAEAVDKPVFLRLVIGNSENGLPDWFLAKDISWFGWQGKRIPVFSCKEFQLYWEDFIDNLAQRYGQRTALIFITGPWKTFGEPYIPSSQQIYKDQWVRETKAADFKEVQANYENFEKDYLIPLFADAFHSSKLGMSNGLGMADSGDHPSRARVWTWAREKYGNRFLVQYNGLNASPDGPDDLTRWTGEQFGPNGLQSQGPLGYQPVGGVSPLTNRGYPIPLDKFDEALNIGLGYGMSFFEAYQSDLKYLQLDPDNPSWKRYYKLLVDAQGRYLPFE